MLRGLFVSWPHISLTQTFTRDSFRLYCFFLHSRIVLWVFGQQSSVTLLENRNEMTTTQESRSSRGGGWGGKESDLVGRNTAAWGHKLPWPWLHFRSILLLLSLLSFLFHPSVFLSASLVPSLCVVAMVRMKYVIYLSNLAFGCSANRMCANSLEVLVLSGGADLGRVALGQFVQAPGVLELQLGFSAEELLQVLQQLQPGLRLLLQTSKLLHQLVTDLCVSKKGEHLQNK